MAVGVGGIGTTRWSHYARIGSSGPAHTTTTVDAADVPPGPATDRIVLIRVVYRSHAFQEDNPVNVVPDGLTVVGAHSDFTSGASGRRERSITLYQGVRGDLSFPLMFTRGADNVPTGYGYESLTPVVVSGTSNDSVYVGSDREENQPVTAGPLDVSKAAALLAVFTTFSDWQRVFPSAVLIGEPAATTGTTLDMGLLGRGPGNAASSVFNDPRTGADRILSGDGVAIVVARSADESRSFSFPSGWARRRSFNHAGGVTEWWKYGSGSNTSYDGVDVDGDAGWASWAPTITATPGELPWRAVAVGMRGSRLELAGGFGSWETTATPTVAPASTTWASEPPGSVPPSQQERLELTVVFGVRQSPASAIVDPLLGAEPNGFVHFYSPPAADQLGTFLIRHREDWEVDPPGFHQHPPHVGDGWSIFNHSVMGVQELLEPEPVALVPGQGFTLLRSVVEPEDPDGEWTGQAYWTRLAVAARTAPPGVHDTAHWSYEVGSEQNLMLAVGLLARLRGRRHLGLGDHGGG